MLRRLPVLLLLLVVAVLATATEADPRGWSEGTTAANTAWVVDGPKEEAFVDLPKDLVRSLRGRTLLVYFAPLCPHCRNVADELVKLSERTKGRLEVIGVATGGSTRGQIDEFVSTFAVPFPVVHDTDGAIGQALGARSTPAALLVVPDGKKVRVLDAFYPYASGMDVAVEMRIADDPWSVLAKGGYLGTQACASCHVEEAMSWQLTHHSMAWRTLKRLDKTEAEECTRCHVTGAGEPGGWDGDPESRLVDVGCEACHGPSGPHDGARVDARTTCEGCHDAKHSIAFRVEKGLPLIDHFAANGMSQQAFRERRLALFDGEAPQELVAFDPGPFVGSSTCASCHAEEHAWWKASPHGRAMESLPEADAKKLECVRCHTSPEAAGPAPTALSGYRLDEGVGCESCHGPGGDHVAAGGGKDNIQGLGESCPVCVLEALCTSCHTSKWDPDWDLERALERTRHDAGAP